MEIGTEELPAAYLPDLIEQLGQGAKALCEANHLSFRQVESFGTPRRLVVLVRGLEGLQRKPAEEIRGPSKQAAYDREGHPTPALLGFLKSRGGTLAQTKLVSSERGEYVYLIMPPAAAPALALLPGLVAQLVTALRAPKTMRWDSNPQRFARPIRWLLVLHGSKLVRCQAGGLASGTATRVGRPMALRSARVASVAQYLQTLERAGIVLDHHARRSRIEQEIIQAAKQVGGRPSQELIRHGLLEEVTFLTEQPTVITGAFDAKYLTLPNEVLLASMAKHQRVFAVETGERLLPKFIGVLEGKPGSAQSVRAVMERILNARLADSWLFWEQDRKRPFGEADLAGVSFHEKLGSMADKTKRLVLLADVLAGAWAFTPQDKEALKRACRLAKSDLVTTMVKEFPTLQGVMGKHYALASGHPPEVAEAIEEQYLPAPSGGPGPAAGRRPRTILGSALAILDKYDTLTGYFAVGIEPTGDQDPFGLRRAAQGIVETLWELQRTQRWGAAWRLSLDELFHARAMMAPFIGMEPSRAAAVGQRVRRYLLDRLYTLDWSRDGERAGPPRDLLDAVLSSPCHDLADVFKRIEGLQQVRPAELVKAAKVLERTRNILKGAALKQQAVDPSRLQEAPERRLWELYTTHRERLVQLATEQRYAEVTNQYGEAFYQPLHDFFDKVMVNVPDQALQQNRLALMKAIQALYTERIADLSNLVILQQQREETA
ncbi:MAG: glycine--tRNA ligase subunit beta [Candidatus Omnitrophica bacterium]|nr:glycine--tRNA ligase subunit beta [Candidatus Omnitrophota bacterium]